MSDGQSSFPPPPEFEEIAYWLLTKNESSVRCPHLFPTLNLPRVLPISPESLLPVG